MTMTKLIRFHHNYGNYNAGETAGFSVDAAKDYVSKGVAEYVTTEIKSSPVDKKVEPVDERVPILEPKVFEVEDLPKKKKKAAIRRRRRREEG